ncbi:unnamed protein product [Spirodela intermedia]|uniref:Uncharacterized protein n=1 Tax=Spirodela intermedia TaxID=51605 RepID=A0A7I8IPB6_SPIIN|nr:unnamed protein product [Spirodela intermedia]CAA6659806.1 unnamed protein product [Spirodela intermedia]
METKREIDHYRLIKNPDTEERSYIIKDKLYKFLMGQHLEYETNTSRFQKRDGKIPFIKREPKTDLKAHLFCTYCQRNRLLGGHAGRSMTNH